MKDYPELEKNEILLKYNQYSHDRFQEVIAGKYYEADYKIVFENTSKLNKKRDEQISLSKYIEELALTTNEPNYEKTNIFQYFKEFHNFLSKFDKNSEKTQNIDTYIKCLCKIYIGNNIHCQVKSNKINNF